ncbi:hypothetical protein COT30_04675 [Candidatus Micrarchaeota archaeon CG08_land_8_20_14_0_20_49_17]|nr:MAG: hypothetical protein AUJ13_01770 [Candidatus Micrarchaeota archaeon CG1_02_49_24]PIU09379.1 MAG: hypothetical protein COT30_04675 [Candidatus Micrarchaeota archaeon CG08_land_8_20_14_0_20_49_17]PIZ94434.1 MAG: hypothetical protein COX84_05235 [Candidatus Micrarchaeota archaeon CG_4_10_14_0_2_um_filter_49_7]HII53704.1 hypothetical protein [Candidatus Micrarchaeota archaeon]
MAGRLALPALLALATFVFLLLSTPFALSQMFLDMNLSNSGLTLLGLDQNLVAAPERAPDAGNPVIFSFVKVVDAFPSVGDADGEWISTDLGAALVWAWGAGSFEGIIDEHNPEACSGTKYAFAKTSQPYAVGNARATAGTAPRTIALGGNYLTLYRAGEIYPEVTQNAANKTVPDYPGLTINIDAAIVFPYRITKTAYRLSCDKTRCTCKQQTTTSEKTFASVVSDSKTYSIETKNFTFFLIRPVLYEQLNYKPAFEFLLLGNRKIANLTIWQNNKTIGEAQFLSFSDYSDEFGYLHARATDEAARKNVTAAAYEHYTHQPTIANITYARQLFVNATMKENESLGENMMAVIISDRFGNAFGHHVAVRNRLAGGARASAGNDTVRGTLAGSEMHPLELQLGEGIVSLLLAAAIVFAFVTLPNA